MKPLDQAFNVAVNHIADRLFPLGYDVSAEAPQSYEALLDHYRQSGRICVWNGASDQTIFADPETNWAFRAWHDSKHVLHHLPFTPEGEFRVCQYQQADIQAIYGNGQTGIWFCRLVSAEIIGQRAYQDCHAGQFPGNQMAFVRAFLDNPAQALAASF